MSKASDSFVLAAPQFIPTSADDLLVTPSGGTQGRLADKLAASGGGVTFTDGTHTVAAASQLTITGGTVGGATPNATLAISGGGLDQLTGDVTAGPGSGSQAATLATVNADVGSFTSANITVDAKGRVTAAADGSGGASPPGTSALIASAIGVDLNRAGDTAMTLSAFATGKFFVVDEIIVTNASVPITTAAAGVWSGAGGTGQNYASGAGSLFTLVNPRDWAGFAGPNTNANGPGAGTMQNTPPIVNVSNPQGSAATADFYVYGRVFS